MRPFWGTFFTPLVSHWGPNFDFLVSHWGPNFEKGTNFSNFGQLFSSQNAIRTSFVKICHIFAYKTSPDLTEMYKKSTSSSIVATFGWLVSLWVLLFVIQWFQYRGVF